MNEATELSDRSVREELKDIPSLFWTLVPEDAINLGYDFYLEISKLDRLERDLLLNYELALIRARIAHAESRMRELRDAYGMIRRDYCTLLNQPAPDEQQALTHLLALVQHDLKQDRQELNKVECQLQQSTLRRLLRMLGIGRGKEADCAEE